MTTPTGDPTSQSKKVVGYRVVGVLMLVAGSLNAAATYATGSQHFAIAGGAFFVAAIFYFVQAAKLKKHTD
jgi:hypothetical protein